MYGDHKIEQAKDDFEKLELMMTDLKAAPDFFQPTNYWAIYEDRFMKELRQHGLRDFRRRDDLVFRAFGAVDFVNPVARVAISQSRMFRTWFRWVPGVQTFSTRIDKFLQRYVRNIDDLDLESYTRLGFYFARSKAEQTSARSISDFSMSLVGNPGGVTEIEGKFYTRQMIQYYLQYVDVCRHVDFRELRIFAELGSGSGRQVEILAQLHPKLTFLLFDIPPQIYVAEQYLTAIFPDRVTSYRETREWTDLSQIESGRIYILGNHKMPLLETAQIDLFWNSASFHEMEPDVVRKYLGYVGESTKWVYLSEDLKGGVKAKKPGDFGILQVTDLEDYISGLPNHKLIEKRQTLRVNGKPLRDHGMIFLRR